MVMLILMMVMIKIMMSVIMIRYVRSDGLLREERWDKMGSIWRTLTQCTMVKLKNTAKSSQL